jgi:N-acetyl-anhydromuramyl-L-alanine amidase AmpD
LLIEASGAITQTVELCRVTPHARSHNPTSIGVAVIGDFRHREPTPLQRAALVRVCATLAEQFKLAPEQFRGHDELIGGSSDPDKQCPGAGLPMPQLRDDIASHLASGFSKIDLCWEVPASGTHDAV